MAFSDCIASAKAQGEITAEEAARLKGLYDAFLRQRAGDGADAPRAARELVAELLAAEQAEKRRRLGLAIRNLKQLEADFDAYGAATGRPDVANAAIAKLEHHGTAPYASVEGRRQAITGMAHARMEDVLHEFRRSAVLGRRRNVARLENVVREAFGQDSGDPAARALAKAWADTAEWLRQRFNAAGGAIGRLENWGLPQFHDARALRRAGRDTWKATIRPLLDPGRMRHPLTGRAVTAAELDEVLDHVFDTVTTAGWARREPRRAPFGRGALATQHAEHRFLVFRDADAWLAYQRDFGEGDPFAAMMRHVNIMARDIAALEVLGPNPNATIEWLKQVITREARLAEAGKPARWRGKPSGAVDRANRKVKQLDRMWAAMRGAAETPVSTAVAHGLGAARNVITSSILGSAAISSLSDLGTQAAARAFAGIPARRTGLDVVAAFLPWTRREAVAAGLILDSARHVFSRQARYVGSLAGPQWSQVLSDRILTWSGLTPWTQAGKHAFGLAFQHEVGRRLHLGFDALPDALRATFRRWGFTADDWDRMRAGGGTDIGSGVTTLRPGDIADETLAERYLEMILQETEFAIPSGSVASRTVLVSSDQPGTFWGEITRSFAQFKSFAAVYMVTNTARIAAALSSTDRGMRARGAAYAGALFVSTTVLGAGALQLKQMAAGRDPRDMTTPEFWGAAFLQGGGLGIYGDFLFADVNRYGGGFPSTLAGPTIEALWEAWTLTGGNAIELSQGKTWAETNAGRELVRFISGHTPGGTLWYARLAYERVLLDQLQWLVDPKANRSFKARQQWWRREQGQEFYWRPGETAPRRGPRLEAAIGR